MPEKDPGAPLNGLLLADKPPGLTSFDVVARLRKAAGIKKIGHLGTLDPPATGLLALLLGPSTRLAPYFSGLAKTYRAGIVLGVETSTLDATGRYIPPGRVNAAAGDASGEAGKKAAEAGKIEAGKNEDRDEWREILLKDPGSLSPPEARKVERERVEEALSALSGPAPQIPPAVSAVKVDGVRSYALARQGRAVVLPPRAVTAFRLELLSFQPPLLEVAAEVSSGYYARALARDLGLALGLGGGILHSLRRLSLGRFQVSAAVSLPFSPKEIRERILSPREALYFLPEYRLTEGEAARVRRGQALGAGELERARLFLPPAGEGFGAPPDDGGEGSLRKQDRLLGFDEYFARPESELTPLAGPVKILDPRGALLGLGEFAGFGAPPKRASGGGDPPDPDAFWRAFFTPRPFLRPRRILTPL
ncbi:MAG: hypothetical protein LBR53_12205 [Deltaproteobacteria bacterium]|jgi:tRNA pseudouridine55 synthase|nr:hypothetical protein [Deltaproteobacteria bacterium]